MASVGVLMLKVAFGVESVLELKFCRQVPRSRPR